MFLFFYCTLLYIVKIKTVISRMRQACAIDHKMTIAPNQAHVKSIFGFYMDCVKYTRFTTIKWMVNVCFIFFRFYYFIPFCTTHDTIIASFTTHIMIIQTFLTLNPSNPFKLLFLSTFLFALPNPFSSYFMNIN